MKCQTPTGSAERETEELRRGVHCDNMFWWRDGQSQLYLHISGKGDRGLSIFQSWGFW